MNFRLYSLLVSLLAPLAAGAEMCRGLRDRRHFAHLRERFGWGAPSHAQPCIWLHAVSLGEVSAAAPLVQALRLRYPAVPFVLTTATLTGRARASALFGNDLDVRYLPYDTAGSVRRFFERIRPRIGIIMETEIWPNLLRECRRRSVPVIFASARLSAQSVARYLRLGSLVREALSNVQIAAQSAEDAGRFTAIGADPARTQVSGNVKFDMQLGPQVAREGRELRAQVLGTRPVWIAGSTHGGEEEQVLKAHAALLEEAPEVLLMLVPRHPQRFDSVAALLTRLGFRFERRSAAVADGARMQVLLVDSVGELAKLYAAADIAFVGGSLVPIGGHNLLEPAALGVPVIVGPYNANGPDIARAMLARGGAVEVGDASQLAKELQRLFADPVQRQRMGAAGREFVEEHRGSVARLLALIAPLMPAGPQR
jgi:3-deoxy-D-manno-octulosonic-acid transferase